MKRIMLVVIGVMLAGNVWAGCDKASALRVDSMTREMGTKTERGSSVTFKWGNDWKSMSRTQKEQMIRSIADADACLKGYPRDIVFYSPTGKKVGVASPDTGIKLY